MARSMWTLFEPVHAVTYFMAEARSAYQQAGLRGFWRGYFAGRAAPLGVAGPAVAAPTGAASAASAAVVAASFFNFAPAFVAGHPRCVGADDAGRGAAGSLARAAEGLGRPLAGREAEAAAAELAYFAVRAGVDLPLFSQDYGTGDQAADGLVTALRAGRLDEAELRASAARVLALRRSLAAG